MYHSDSKYPVCIWTMQFLFGMEMVQMAKKIFKISSKNCHRLNTRSPYAMLNQLSSMTPHQIRRHYWFWCLDQFVWWTKQPNNSNRHSWSQLKVTSGRSFVIVFAFKMLCVHKSNGTIEFAKENTFTHYVRKIKKLPIRFSHSIFFSQQPKIQP